MNRASSSIVLIAVLALAGCGDWHHAAAAAAPPPAATRSVQAPKPAPTSGYQKPVRMFGRGEISSISLEEFFALQQSGNAMIFDARMAIFYQLGHIPGAINLSKHNTDEAIAARENEIKAAVQAGKTLVVYCSSATCPDARTVAIHLSGFGYPVKVFAGGWDAWREAGMPGA